MPVYLLIASVVIIACVVLNRVSSKLGIPMLLAFIVLGMVFGSDGLVKIPFDNYIVAEDVCSVALIFIMFYGGFGTKWSQAKPVVGKAVLLSTVGVILTALLTGTFCYFVLHMALLESFLVGSVISSTDAASVFYILRSKKLNLKYNTASLLEVESGSNDPCSYMLTAILLTFMSAKADAGKVLYLIFSQLVYGVIFGLIIAAAALWVLKKFPFHTDGFDTAFVLAAALFAYALPSAVNGNGYLSVYIVGIILGNSNIKNKITLVHFFDGITTLMQVLIFFLLGLLAFPSELPKVAVPAMLIALFLTLVARPLSVCAIMAPFRCKLNQQVFVAWAGLRGAASIVFAVMATVHPAALNNDIFHIVFCIVLFSILLQGSLMPLVAKKLGMIDDKADVMKTFTDYVDEAPVSFIQFTVTDNHPWNEKAVKDILLPPDTLLVLLQRDNEKIVPRGNTVLQSGDKLVLTAMAVEDMAGMHLYERIVDADSDYVGKKLVQIASDPEKLIVMIQRRGNIVIPTGETVLMENDILVITEMQGIRSKA